MKKEMLLKVILCLVCAAGIVLMDMLAVKIIAAKQVSFAEVPVASRDIPPRTKITDQDLRYIRVPENYALDNTCLDREDIIDHYTDIQGSIPCGSPFYRSMLKEEKDLPDEAVLQLKDGQAVYTHLLNEKDPFSLTAGMRVDLWLSMPSEDTGSGVLIENARILALNEDSQGNKAELAVDQKDLALLRAAETWGEIVLSVSSSAYESSEAMLVRESPCVLLLEEKMRENSGEIQ